MDDSAQGAQRAGNASPAELAVLALTRLGRRLGEPYDGYDELAVVPDFTGAVGSGGIGKRLGSSASSRYRCPLDISRAAADLGHQPSVSLDDAVAHCLAELPGPQTSRRRRVLSTEPAKGSTRTNWTAPSECARQDSKLQPLGR